MIQKIQILLIAYKDEFIMDIPRKLGILIFSMVPAVIGGGIVFHFFNNFAQVIIFEIILILLVLGLISR